MSKFSLNQCLLFNDLLFLLAEIKSDYGDDYMKKLLSKHEYVNGTLKDYCLELGVYDFEIYSE